MGCKILISAVFLFGPHVLLRCFRLLQNSTLLYLSFFVRFKNLCFYRKTFSFLILSFGWSLEQTLSLPLALLHPQWRLAWSLFHLDSVAVLYYCRFQQFYFHPTLTWWLFLAGSFSIFQVVHDQLCLSREPEQNS